MAGQAQEKQFSIIPEPAEITVVGEGTVQIERGMLVRVSDSSLVASADFLADYTNRYLGIPLRVDVPKKGKKRTADKAVNGIVLVNRNNGEVSGGYRLEVIPGTGVRIEGNDAAGVFYGVQTLIQMLPVRAGVLPILAAWQGRGYPRFAYRGMHLDVVRHFFPVEFIKKYIDYLALHKLNYFHWHLTDDQAWRVEMKCRPELTAKGSVREGEIEGLYPGKYQRFLMAVTTLTKTSARWCDMPPSDTSPLYRRLTFPGIAWLCLPLILNSVLHRMSRRNVRLPGESSINSIMCLLPNRKFSTF